MAQGGMRGGFTYETDATDAAEAIRLAGRHLGAKRGDAVRVLPTTVLGLQSLPERGRADDVPRRTREAYRLASAVRYQAPVANDVSGTDWELSQSAPTSPRFAVAIDCGIPQWEVASYRKVPHTKATARFHLRYVVEADGVAVGDFEKVTEAKELAHGLFADPSVAGLDAPPAEVSIRRRPVSDGGSDLATAYVRHVRTSKVRPTKTPQDATVTAVHRWLVYGTA